jgi:hypothetical protein
VLRVLIYGVRKLTSIELVVILAALALSWTFQAAILTAGHSTADKVVIEEVPLKSVATVDCPGHVDQVAGGDTPPEAKAPAGQCRAM